MAEEEVPGKTAGFKLGEVVHSGIIPARLSIRDEGKNVSLWVHKDMIRAPFVRYTGDLGARTMRLTFTDEKIGASKAHNKGKFVQLRVPAGCVKTRVPDTPYRKLTNVSLTPTDRVNQYHLHVPRDVLFPPGSGKRQSEPAAESGVVFSLPEPLTLDLNQLRAAVETINAAVANGAALSIDKVSGHLKLMLEM